MIVLLREIENFLYLAALEMPNGTATMCVPRLLLRVD
jgi:hypothetical protein